MAVDGVGFNFKHHFSSSVYVAVDTKLFDPFLSMCDQPYYQRISVHIVNFIYGNDFFNLVDTIFGLVDMKLSCGLWILFYYISQRGWESLSMAALKRRSLNGRRQRQHRRGEKYSNLVFADLRKVL